MYTLLCDCWTIEADASEVEAAIARNRAHIRAVIYTVGSTDYYVPRFAWDI